MDERTYQARFEGLLHTCEAQAEQILLDELRRDHLWNDGEHNVTLLAKVVTCAVFFEIYRHGFIELKGVVAEAASGLAQAAKEVGHVA